MKEILRNMRKDDDIAKIKNKENEMQITSKKCRNKKEKDNEGKRK